MPRRELTHLCVKALLVVSAFFAVGPLVWVLLASLSTNEKVGVSPTGFWGGFHISNYLHAFTQSSFGSFFLNSVLISMLGALLLAATAACAAYALSKLSFPGRRLIFSLVLIGLVVPVYGYFVQLSSVAMTLHLYNTRTVDVLTEVAVYSPIPILIMFSFYQRVPREMIEAAKVDGAMEFALFTRVVLPLARPAVVLCLVFGFVWIWSDLFLPSVLLVSQSKYPIPAGISFIIGESTQVPPYVLLFAATIMSTLPMILVYGYMSRHVGDAITGGAVRG